MGISIGGLISGMDTDKIITQLQDLQKKPILQLQQKEADYQVKISAYSTLQGGLKGLKNAAKNLDAVSDITSYSATSSNTSIFTAMAESTAASGSHSITVNSLAAAHKLTSKEGFTGAVGKGAIHLSMGSATADIEVGLTSTISDIADAINAEDIGIYATIINDGTKSYLTLSGKETGVANAINLTVTEDGTDPTNGLADNTDLTGLSRLVFDSATTNLKQIQAAANSDITVDGVENISRATNTIDDVISGVTLNLKSKSTDLINPETVSVERSTDLFTTRMNAFLDAYNGLMDSLNNLQSYDSETQETGMLFGDSTTRRIQGEVRSLFSNSVTGLSAGLNRLTDFGVSTDEDGKAVLDSTVFKAKLKDNFEDVAKFFTQTSTGFAVRMTNSMEKMLDTSSGVLAVRTKGIQKSIDTMDDQISRLNLRLTKSETRLRAQFASLEAILGKYQGLSDSVTANLEQIQNSWGTSSN
jgi:flagellar hook-associated protein 2